MKSKILVAGIGSILAFAMVASAAGYTFSNYLSVGSTGADVTALQTWLLANGFVIPSISSGAAAKGYFGSQTKAAVVKYQASIGLPNTGFVGPLTIAKLNGTASAPVAMGCPTGFTCTPITGTTPPVNTTPGTISTPGVAGTLAVSLWSTPSNNTTVYKGQAYDVVAYKLQAAASDMAVTSLSLDFDTRIWLYANTITVRDDSGAVVGQLNNLNASNFSELTVGSDYRVSVPVNNYVVKATQSKYFTVNLSFNPVSDRESGSLNVTNAQVRSVDGTGVTDTETVPATRSFSYQGSNIGQIVVTVDSSSPLKGLVQISTAAQTQNIPLAVYDVKSQNEPSTLQSLTLGIGQSTTTQIFSNIQIKVGGQVYSASSLSTTSAAFTNLQIPLAADVYTPITVYGTIAQDTNNYLDGVSASTTWVLSSNNPSVVDATYNNVAINGGTFISSDLIFSASSATVSNETASATAVGQSAAAYTVSFGFTITAGNNTLYVSKDLMGNAFVGTTTTGGIAASLTTLSANPDSLSGDDTAGAGTEYVIPAGSSRQFTVSGSATGVSGQSGAVSINAVHYGLASGNYSKTIGYNLGGLKTTAIVIP